MRGKNNPNYKHGKKNTRLYRIWANIKSRCHNPNTTQYHRYGARGITVCDEWKNDFQTFYDWAMSHGYDEHLTIDRIDNDKGYSPGNCRWVTMKDQCMNRCDNHLVTLNGVTKSLMTWCNSYGINYKTVQDRLKRGWTHQDAVTKPVQIKFRKKVE